MKCRQGEIWWANLPSPAGRRPVLILTRTDAALRLRKVTIAPLTRTIRHLESEVVLTPAVGVPSLSAISLDNIITIEKHLLDRRITRLSSHLMTAVFGAIRFVFDMPEPPPAAPAASPA